MTTTATLTVPPSVDDIVAVLEEHADHISSFAAAAMHLAMPCTDALVGPDVFRRDGQWMFRGCTVTAADDLQGAAEAAHTLATRTRTSTDRYLPVRSMSGADLAKFAVSGDRWVGFGMMLLCGTGLVADRHIPEQVLQQVANKMFDGTLDSDFDLFSVNDATFYTRVENNCVTVECAEV